MLLSIIVPCYNEREVLPLFYRKTGEVLEKMGCEYELILVDDGSRDGTLAVMKDLAQKDQHVKYLSFSRNFGKESAMYAGLVSARGDYVAVMDADMQDPPSLLPRMLDRLQTGEYDCVAARRVSRQGEPKIRSFFARGFYKLVNLISEAEIVDGARDFRLMKREMVQAVLSMGEYNRFSKGIFSWVGFRTAWVEYENAERAAGTTKWSFWGLVKYAMDGVVSFSQAPLSFIAWLGLIMTAFAAVMLVFVVVRKLIFGDPVTGWASTMSVIIFIGGLQLFCLGIIAQYLAKTYMETKRRPHYIIAETNDPDAEKIR